MDDTLEVYGSYGTLTVDRNSGTILSYSPEPDDTPEYADIVRFDVNEARAFYGDEWPSISHLDIIRIGFWTDAGVYVENERADLDAAMGV